MNLSKISPMSAWQILIKPERIPYSIENLGSTISCFKNYDCYRKDFTFLNEQKSKICVSLFFPIKQNINNLDFENLKLNGPCIVYCHSQSGNRVEGNFLKEYCIENGFGLCLFDFNGCGKSEGEYVTLGWREQDDLSQLILILLKDYNVTSIGLWGRSMGAVTCLHYAKRNSMYIRAMVK